DSKRADWERSWPVQGRHAAACSSEALWQVLQLPDDVRASPELRTALAIHWAFVERNFARFFRLARALPCLPSCALLPHVGRARQLALLTFSHGFSARNSRYPLAQLAQLLAVDTLEEAAGLCRAHGLTVLEGGFVVFQKGSFKDPGPLECRPSRVLVEAKWGDASLLEFAEDVCS
uniref:SAC3/GANP/THP3 conserved domain-containing protein n=1 Tax=Varanus komodoensis TaxID=61221 RepID=A0A8D2IK58_VARKO